MQIWWNLCDRSSHWKDNQVLTDLLVYIKYKSIDFFCLIEEEKCCVQKDWKNSFYCSIRVKKILLWKLLTNSCSNQLRINENTTMMREFQTGGPNNSNWCCLDLISFWYDYAEVTMSQKWRKISSDPGPMLNQLEPWVCCLKLSHYNFWSSSCHKLCNYQT